MASLLPISLKRSLRCLEMYLRPRQLYEMTFKVDGDSESDVMTECLYPISKGNASSK